MLETGQGAPPLQDLETIGFFGTWFWIFEELLFLLLMNDYLAPFASNALRVSCEQTLRAVSSGYFSFESNLFLVVHA